MALKDANLSLAAAPVGGANITPSDSTVLDMRRALWVGGAGNVTVRMADGSQITLTGVPANTMLALQFDKVMSTGTTATAMVGLY